MQMERNFFNPYYDSPPITPHEQKDISPDIDHERTSLSGQLFSTSQSSGWYLVGSRLTPQN